MSHCTTGATPAIPRERLREVEDRYLWVKQERERKLENWKRSLNVPTADANQQIGKYQKKLKKLDKDIRNGINVDTNRKRRQKFDDMITLLNDRKYTDKDLMNQQGQIFGEVMQDKEGKICPFCGHDCGSEKGVDEHLNEQNQGLEKAELAKLNQVATRSDDYARKYKKKHGASKFDVQVPLEQFGNQLITVEIGEEIHHLISVDPYASTLRVSRIGNLLGFNVNQDNNLVSAPSVEPSSFKKNHQVAYTDLPEQDKQRIAKAAIQKSQKQFHKGDHSFEKPEAGVISYEKKLVQDMAEIEHEILAMSEEAGKCLGQTKAGREQVKDMVKGKLTGLQERIKADLFKFQPAPGEQPTVERFLAKVDYDYHMRK